MDNYVDGVRVIVADEHHDCEHLLGKFLDESHYDVLIDEDCDFYAPPENTLFGVEETSEEKCIFKLRKGFFSMEEQRGAYEGLRDAAVASNNRGIAAGDRTEMTGNRVFVTERHLRILDMMMNPAGAVIDDAFTVADAVADKSWGNPNSKKGEAWIIRVVGDNFDFEKWAEETVKLSPSEMNKKARELSKGVSTTTYANEVHSGIAGWFDRYPRIPFGRATSYTANNPEKFARSYPFLQKLSKGFSKFLPERFVQQKKCADSLDPAFVVPETPFTTLTVNKTFRTAAHRDAGDLKKGFSNLSVITNKEKCYTGGYLVLPEFRVAVNIRPGDLLLINNHDGIHGNTPIEIDDDGERVSVVCYFRENMLELGSKPYEDARAKFVEQRRNDKNHPEWRPLWNGISPGMFETDEWYKFLYNEIGEEELLKYHPKAKGSIEEYSSCSRREVHGESVCKSCNKICK